MAKEKNLLMFHNRMLMYISPGSVQFFGGNPCTLRDRSFFEIFMNPEDNFLDILKENKKHKLRLVTCDKNIINCELTKSVTEKNETVCIYFKDSDAQMVLKPDSTEEKGIYQETIEKNLSNLFSYLNSLENTRNSDIIADLKRALFSFSLDIFDLLSINKKDNVTTFNSTYINFDLPSFIESEISSIKKEFNGTNINYLSSPILPFNANANKAAFKELLYSITAYLSDFAETIIFNMYINAENLILIISESELYTNALKPSEKKTDVNITDIQKLLELNELAKKSGVNFKCIEHNNKIYRFEFTFPQAQRKKIYEDDKKH